MAAENASEIVGLPVLWCGERFASRVRITRLEAAAGFRCETGAYRVLKRGCDRALSYGAQAVDGGSLFRAPPAVCADWG